MLKQALLQKLKNLRRGYKKYSLASDHIEHPSVEYSRIPLKKECKYVLVMYNEDVTDRYHTIIAIFVRAKRDENMSTVKMMDQLERYVMGWRQGKELTDESMDSFFNHLKYCTKSMEHYIASINKEWEGLSDLNKSEDDMVDTFQLNLHRYTKELYYSRVYNKLFGKVVIDERYCEECMQRNIDGIDKLISFLDVLYGETVKTGNDESFEQYREAQRWLIEAVQMTSNFIELSCQFYSTLMEVANMVVNFKAYPD